MGISSNGEILDPPPGAVREMTELRDVGGKKNLHTKIWEMPNGKRHFKTSPAEAHYVDAQGDVKTRRLRWVDEGNGVVACRGNGQRLRIDTDDLRWRMRHSDETHQVTARLSRIDNTPVPTPLPSVDVVYPGIHKVVSRNIDTDTDWWIAITPTLVLEAMRLRSASAPRDFTWTFRGDNIVAMFDFLEGHRRCVENYRETAVRAPEETSSRLLQIQDFGGPNISTLPDGRDRIRVRKRWTGSVGEFNPTTLQFEWRNDLPVEYPVLITPWGGVREAKA